MATLVGVTAVRCGLPVNRPERRVLQKLNEGIDDLSLIDGASSKFSGVAHSDRGEKLFRTNPVSILN
jgi:hypothetical protein